MKCCSFLILSLLICNCATSEDFSPSHQFSITSENGVSIATTTGGPKYQGELFEYREELRLQQDESNPESLVAQPWGFAMGEDGSFFVLDGFTKRILVYSPEGIYSHNIGRSGSGPGEFLSVRDMIVHQDIIGVYDGRIRRYSQFHTDGSFLNSISAATLPQFLRSLNIGPNGERICVHAGGITASERDQQFDQQSVLVLSAQGDTLAEWETPSVYLGQLNPLERYETTVRAEQHFSGELQAGYIPGRGIYVTTGVEPWINWYDLTGTLMRIIRVDVPRDPVTDAERNQVLQAADIMIEQATNPRARASARKKKETMNIPEFKDYWARIIVDEIGYIWAHTPTEYLNRINQPSEIKVFNPEGEYLGRTKWPENTWSSSHGHLLRPKLSDSFYGDII